MEIVEQQHITDPYKDLNPKSLEVWKGVLSEDAFSLLKSVFEDSDSTRVYQVDLEDCQPVPSSMAGPTVYTGHGSWVRFKEYDNCWVHSSDNKDGEWVESEVYVAFKEEIMIVTLSDKEELLAEGIEGVAEWKADIARSEERHADYVARVRADIAFAEELNSDLAAEIAREKEA